MATITTDAAEELIDEGTPVLDVRTPEEFADGHIPGAKNIPFALAGDGGMVPNASFEAEVSAHFEKDAPLVLHCKAGGRSAKAALILQNAGFKEVFDMKAGWSGSRDEFGSPIMGWQAEGREVELDAEAEQVWQNLKA